MERISAQTESMEPMCDSGKRTVLVYFPELNSSHREAIRAAAERNGFEAVFCDGGTEARFAAARAEVMLTASPALAENAPLLRWLCTHSAGINQFSNTEAFLSGRAILSNSSGAYGVTIAEHIIMVTLEMLRRQQEYNQIVSARKWRRDLPIRAIRGSRITLLGTGDIGRETACRLKAFAPDSITGVNRSGMNRDECFDRVLRQDRLDEALPETDLLIISLPGTPETAHMMDASRLSLLPDGALVVNVGRGAVIDQDALEKELRAGRLMAALDVFEREPLPQDVPLWTCPHLLITPHCAGNTTLPYTVERIVALFLEDFERYCAGRPLARQVDMKKGY